MPRFRHLVVLVSSLRPGLGLWEFADLLAERGLASSWGRRGELGGVWTTFSARTHLQPQGHKAVGPAAGGAEHRRLRDWVVFPVGRAAAAGPAERDNTGRGALAEVRTVPSAAFPSDHAVVLVFSIGLPRHLQTLIRVRSSTGG